MNISETTKEFVIRNYGSIDKVNPAKLDGMNEAFNDFIKLIPRLSIEKAKDAIKRYGDNCYRNLESAKTPEDKNWHYGYMIVVWFLTDEKFFSLDHLCRA